VKPAEVKAPVKPLPTGGVGAAATPATPPPQAAAQDPHELLRQGRDMLAAGNYDEANRLAGQARKAGSRWGLFEDSPDKLQQDVDKVRAQRDQDESVKMMADARKRFEQKDLDGASQLAYKAQR